MGKFNLMDLLNTQQSGQAEPPQVSEREETQPRKPAYKIVALSVFDLVPSEGNFYSIAEIEKLKRDIELAGGVKQNLTVIPLDGGKYKVLAATVAAAPAWSLCKRVNRNMNMSLAGLSRGSRTRKCGNPGRTLDYHNQFTAG